MNSIKRRASVRLSIPLSALSFYPFYPYRYSRMPLCPATVDRPLPPIASSPSASNCVHVIKFVAIMTAKIPRPTLRRESEFSTLCEIVRHLSIQEFAENNRRREAQILIRRYVTCASACATCFLILSVLVSFCRGGKSLSIPP